MYSAPRSALFALGGSLVAAALKNETWLPVSVPGSPWSHLSSAEAAKMRRGRDRLPVTSLIN